MTDNTEELIREAYRRSELRLQSQLTTALAADARAMTFGGLMIAAATILVGLAVESTDPKSLWVSSIFLAIAATMAMYTARPVGFHVPGGVISNLSEDIDGGVDALNVLRQLSEHMEKYQNENNDVLERNGKLVRVALGIALASPVSGILAQLWF